MSTVASYHNLCTSTQGSDSFSSMLSKGWTYIVAVIFIPGNYVRAWHKSTHEKHDEFWVMYNNVMGTTISWVLASLLTSGGRSHSPEVPHKRKIDLDLMIKIRPGDQSVTMRTERGLSMYCLKQRRCDLLWTATIWRHEIEALDTSQLSIRKRMVGSIGSKRIDTCPSSRSKGSRWAAPGWFRRAWSRTRTTGRRRSAAASTKIILRWLGITLCFCEVAKGLKIQQMIGYVKTIWG